MMCSFHDKCSLTITPRSFIDGTFSILHPLKVKNRLIGSVFELGVLNNIYRYIWSCQNLEKVYWQLASYQCCRDEHGLDSESDWSRSMAYFVGVGLELESVFANL